jgi:hypothetical protein
MVDELLAIKRIAASGGLRITDTAKALLDKIYKIDHRLDDVRFEHYLNRRFTHLIKLCIIHCLSRKSLEISEEDVILSNTILSHTEKLMPKALGEFGESKNARVAHKIISVLENNYRPLPIAELWKQVSSDMEQLKDLITVLQGLITAGKVLRVEDGFLIKRRVMIAEYSDVVDYGYLSSEEAGPLGAHHKLEVVA